MYKTKWKDRKWIKNGIKIFGQMIITLVVEMINKISQIIIIWYCNH